MVSSLKTDSVIESVFIIDKKGVIHHIDILGVDKLPDTEKTFQILADLHNL